jgi:hypothetical protein
MKKQKITLIFSMFLAVGFLVGTVNASGGVFVIEPAQEVIDTIKLTVSKNVSVNVCGSVSVIDGFIDFYVTSPSGIVLFYRNGTASDSFNFTVVENGTYVFHLRNTFSANNVTTTLDYGVNKQFSCYGEIPLTWHTAAVVEVTIASPAPFDWIGLSRTFVGLLSAFYTILKILEILDKYWNTRKWNKKYKEIRTPSDIKPLRD